MLYDIDLHTHILPGLDDGAKDEATALAMLRSLKAQGVGTVCLTSHFFHAHGPVAEFLKKRQQAFEKIAPLAVGDDYPRMVLGAEVYLTPYLARLENLDRLKLGNSPYLLLELPMDAVTASVLRYVEEVMHQTGLNVIVAHAERLLLHNKLKTLTALREAGCQFQMNAGCLRGATKRVARRALKTGYIDYLGTDCHDLIFRPPIYKDGKEEIFAVTGKKIQDKILRNMIKLQQIL